MQNAKRGKLKAKRLI